MFNLLDDPWLPARRAEGQLERIRPAEITSDIATNPIVAIDWPRPDFRVACIEFLIGLIATAYPPADDEDAWIEGWKNPPSPEALSTAFAPIAHAFNLDGAGPRFLQDFDELPGDPDSPETLLIEAPGENTVEKNTTLFVKPHRIARLSRPAGAMALFTLQCYAPQGGSGYHVSVRGGGPLTTLAIPADKPWLWHLVWANTPRRDQPLPGDLSRVFPWLGPTRTADRFPNTTPAATHPLQAFWGMPWRIRLDFAENVKRQPCDLTGAVEEVIVNGWRKRNQGVNYFAWEHPLSPSQHNKKDGSWHSWLAKAGIGYRDWVAIALRDATDTRPALCISSWQARSEDVSGQRTASRLLAAGFNMVKNRKAYAFVESEMPLAGTSTEAGEALAIVARKLVRAAEIVADGLQQSVRVALFGKANKGAPPAGMIESFWASSQDRFFVLLRVGGFSDWEAGLGAVALAWHAELRRVSVRLFDEAAPLDPSLFHFTPRDPRRPGRQIPRIVEGRSNLLNILSGYGKTGGKLFNVLELPSPEPKTKRRARGAAMEAT